jgi:hypothetical protein
MNGSFAGKEEIFSHFFSIETRLDSMWFGETSMSSSEDIRKIIFFHRNFLTEKTKKWKEKFFYEFA